MLPYDQEFRWWLSGVYVQTGQFEKAPSVFEDVARVIEEVNECKVPNTFYYFMWMGECFHQLKQYDGGIRLMEIPKDSIEGDWGVSREFYRAVFHQAKGDLAKALYHRKEYRKLFESIDSGPEYPDMYDARFYLKTGELNKALDVYRNILEMKPEYWPAKMGLARQMIENDIDVDLGVAYAEEILGAHEGEYDLWWWPPIYGKFMNKDVYNTLGWGYFKQGKYEEAVAMLETAWNNLIYYDHEHKVRLDAAREALAKQK